MGPEELVNLTDHAPTLIAELPGPHGWLSRQLGLRRAARQHRRCARGYWPVAPWQLNFCSCFGTAHFNLRLLELALDFASRAGCIL
jgi:hypothetical protein